MEVFVKSKKIGNKYFIRIDPGEEIVSTLKEFCIERSIKLGKISAIGAVNEAEIGIFDPLKKEYHSNTIKGTFEILSITGNITSNKDQPYLHMHITLSDSKFNAFGGHLNKAFVSATCEVIIEEFEGKLVRYYDENIRLNLLELE
ncbi:MAG: DNA-binding protein [Candidatus Cloacimonadota bacterium]|nr:MAG: DNA-binding protein [Candidatus Cloacimonadota bacterium]